MSLTKELLAGACGDGSTGWACPTAAVAGLQIKPCGCRRRRLDDDARFSQTSIQNPTYSLAPTAIDKQPPPAPGAASATGAGGVPYDGPTRSIGANSFPLPLSEEEGEGGYYHYLMTRIDEVGGVGLGLGWSREWVGMEVGVVEDQPGRFESLIVFYVQTNRPCWGRRRSRSSCGASPRSRSAASPPVRASVCACLDE